MFGCWHRVRIRISLAMSALDVPERNCLMATRWFVAALFARNTLEGKRERDGVWPDQARCQEGEEDLGEKLDRQMTCAQKL